MEDASEILLTARKFSVVRKRHLTAQGDEVSREIIVHPGAVTIVPMIDSEHVCLIQNYRIAAEQTLWELPAGTIDPGEDPQETAIRELSEETGYRAGSIEKLHAFFLSPGILDERMHVYLATNLEPGETDLETGEEIVTHTVAWSEALAMADDGRIQDAKTLVSLYYCDRLRRFG